ncbi:MAG: TetR/AcrR family transcriptional regulator C-terminal domain-containing protein [Ilumatobacteraceae bacterium]
MTGLSARGGQRPARRRDLTRARVVATALAIVDAEGLDAVTMRRVAGELGVEAMSLYTHVRDKQDLVNAMNLLVLSQLDEPVEGDDWAEVLRTFARRLYDAYVPRPELARVLERTAPTSPEAFGAMERVLAALDRAGLEPSDQVSAFRGVIAVCLGFVLVHAGDESRRRAPDEPPWSAWDEPTMTGSAMPHIVRLAPAFGTTSHDADFEFVIGACIRELQARTDTTPAQPRRRRAKGI